MKISVCTISLHNIILQLHKCEGSYMIVHVADKQLSNIIIDYSTHIKQQQDHMSVIHNLRDEIVSVTKKVQL